MRIQIIKIFVPIHSNRNLVTGKLYFRGEGHNLPGFFGISFFPFFSWDKDAKGNY